MATTTHAQTYVWDSTGRKTNYVREEIDIIDTGPGDTLLIRGDVQEGGDLFTALMPSALDAGFRLIEAQIAKNMQRYEGQYNVGRSNLKARERRMPHFSVERRIWREGRQEHGDVALRIDFKAKSIDGMKNTMVYYIDAIELNHSKAKIKRAGDRLDYTIALKFDFLEDRKTEMTGVAVSPIVVRSVKFGRSNDLSQGDRFKYRSDFIILPESSFLAKISVDIIETNPRKIRAEKVQQAWSAYRDEARKGTEQLIQLLLPRPEQGKGDKDETNDRNAMTNNPSDNK